MRGRVPPQSVRIPPSRQPRAWTQRSIRAAAARAFSQLSGFWPARPHSLAGSSRRRDGAWPRWPLPADHAPSPASVSQSKHSSWRSGASLQVRTSSWGLRRGVAGCPRPETRDPRIGDHSFLRAAAPIQPPGAGSSRSPAGGSGLGLSRPLGRVPAAGACLGSASHCSPREGWVWPRPVGDRERRASSTCRLFLRARKLPTRPVSPPLALARAPERGWG